MEDIQPFKSSLWEFYITHHWFLHKDKEGHKEAPDRRLSPRRASRSCGHCCAARTPLLIPRQTESCLFLYVIFVKATSNLNPLQIGWLASSPDRCSLESVVYTHSFGYYLTKPFNFFPIHLLHHKPKQILQNMCNRMCVGFSLRLRDLSQLWSSTKVHTYNGSTTSNFMRLNLVWFLLLSNTILTSSGN